MARPVNEYANARTGRRRVPDRPAGVADAGARLPVPAVVDRVAAVLAEHHRDDRPGDPGPDVAGPVPWPDVEPMAVPGRHGLRERGRRRGRSRRSVQCRRRCSGGRRSSRMPAPPGSRRGQRHADGQACGRRCRGQRRAGPEARPSALPAIGADPVDQERLAPLTCVAGPQLRTASTTASRFNTERRRCRPSSR